VREREHDYSKRRFGIAVFGFPQDHFDNLYLCSSKFARSDDTKKVFRHVFGRRISIERIQSLARYFTNCFKRFDIVLIQNEAMIPMLVDPASDASLEITEIDYPPKLVQLGRRGMQQSDIVVAMQMSAFVLVFPQTMPGAKLNPSYALNHQSTFPGYSVPIDREFGNRS
jgi:hypothetical protein